MAVAVTLPALACVTEAPAEDDESVAIAAAQSVRELRFSSLPRVEHRSREEYLQTQDAQAAAAPDETVAYLHAVWGRLGYFPPSFDVRAAWAGQAGQVGAFYETAERAITVFGGPTRSVLVHELVHALQDQVFDLRALGRRTKSTDEALALGAVVEGDAALCQQRFDLAEQGRDPLPALPAFLDMSDARLYSDRILASAKVPFFAQYASFVYPFGTVFAARIAGAGEAPPRWSREAMDAAFGASAPRSTKEVLDVARQRPITPIVDVGLSRLPAALVDRYDVDSVDRLGTWSVYMLLRSGPVPPLFDDVLAWTGDQLVVLGERDLRIPRPWRAPTGIVWTTAWDGSLSARRFADQLGVALGITTAAAGDGLPRARDGEVALIEQRDAQVVLVKGPPIEDMRALASAALGSRDARLPITRRFALENVMRLGGESP